MDPFQALCELPNLIAEFKKAAAELAQAQHEIELRRNDKYVDIKWVAAFFNLDEKTCRLMLADVPMLVHNKRIRRFKKSDIILFAAKHSVKVKDVNV